MFLPALITSSTNSSWLAITVLSWINCLFTRYVSQMPSMDGSIGLPVNTSMPSFAPVFAISFCTSSSVSYVSLAKSSPTITSNPLFSASTFGITSRASANAHTPNFAFPSTDFAYSNRCALHASSNAPAPGTSFLSSSAFYSSHLLPVTTFTARSPSRAASFS